MLDAPPSRYESKSVQPTIGQTRQCRNLRQYFALVPISRALHLLPPRHRVNTIQIIIPYLLKQYQLLACQMTVLNAMIE